MPKSLIDNFSSKEFANIINSSTSYIECLNKMGYKSRSGTTYKILKARIEKEGLDISHFTGHQFGSKTLTKEMVFKKDSSVSQHALRNWFKEEPIKYECSICGQLPIWQNKSLTLILDHINGINNDNRLENLRWVCPNCNQQLETTGYKHIRRIKK